MIYQVHSDRSSGMDPVGPAGYLTPKRENLGGLSTRHYPSHAFLHTPKEENGPTYILTSGDTEVSSPSLGLTTLYTESTPLTYTPPLDLGSETTYWSHFHGSQGPETPLRGRGGPPERTLLVERLPQHSSFLVTPERQPLDFLSPERNRHTSGPDSGKRGRPRADIINNLMMEGAQSKNAIKCHICSRFVKLTLSQIQNYFFKAMFQGLPSGEIFTSASANSHRRTSVQLRLPRLLKGVHPVRAVEDPPTVARGREAVRLFRGRL